MIKIYDSLSRTKAELPEPDKQKKLQFFVCGPTVYDYAHIGHARTYIFFDFFAKYLRSRGYEVEYLQNITDIDDKIIKRAAEENKKPLDVAKFFTKAYLEDMKAIGVDAVTKYAPATKYIPQIVTQVERLIEKSFAYKIDGDGWYFDIAKDKEYGKLSGRTALQAEDAVSRIDEAVGKRNKGDFCLWKFSKSGEPSWPSEKLGEGRPGWHIEDTAITEKFFGPQYDIHGGGVDLKFPHHEAEIAQQESASGKQPFVKIWMHTGALLADGKKMSKSLGNFITIRDFLKKYDADVLRWITLTHHYQSPVDFSEESAKQAKIALNDMKQSIARLEFQAKHGRKTSGFDINSVVKEAEKRFQSVLSDNLNVPLAIARLFGLLELKGKEWAVDPELAKGLSEYLKEKLSSLGFSIDTPEIPDEVKAIIDKREQYRVSKQFIQSDALRKEADDLGYIIEDTPQGPFVWPKK